MSLHDKLQSLRRQEVLCFLGCLAIDTDRAIDDGTRLAFQVYTELTKIADDNGFDGRYQLLKALHERHAERAHRLAEDACAAIPADEFEAVLATWQCDALLTQTRLRELQ